MKFSLVIKLLVSLITFSKDLQKVSGNTYYSKAIAIIRKFELNLLLEGSNFTFLHSLTNPFSWKNYTNESIKKLLLSCNKSTILVEREQLIDAISKYDFLYSKQPLVDLNLTELQSLAMLYDIQYVDPKQEKDFLVKLLHEHQKDL